MAGFRTAFPAVCCFLVLFSISAYASSQTKVLVFGLKQSNLELLEQTLLRVSDPSSSQYGKHLTRDQVRKLVEPSQHLIYQVTSWLVSIGAKEVKLLASGDWMRAKVPAAMADLILHNLNGNMRLNDWNDQKNRLFISRLGVDHQAILAQFRAIDPMIDVVVEQNHPNSGELEVTQVNNGRQARARRVPVSRFAPQISGSPNNQKAAYQMPTNLIAKASNNSQMVWGPGTYGILKSDLSDYYSEYSVPANADIVTQQGYKGTPGGDNFGEATLDTEIITSMAPGVPTIVYNSNNSQSTEEGLGFGYAFLDFLQNLSSAPQVPWVLSLSLGSLSWDSCNMMCILVEKNGYSMQQCVDYLNHQRQICMYDSSDQINRMDAELMKLGSRGVTILAATGDGGSHFSFQFFPNTGMGKALNKISCQYNFPTFPAESSWVVGVGGTQWGSSSSRPEAWSASGGGFSWRFPRPSYQQTAVSNYLQTQGTRSNFPSAGSYNATNRAYPDVAALADNVPIVIQGFPQDAGGTSASAPSWAGIISMINDQRLSSGLNPLGFVNPRLYQVAASYPGDAFYDVTKGNTACASDGNCCTQGFPAAIGWDPTTGLGSPLWPGLIKYLGSD